MLDVDLSIPSSIGDTFPHRLAVHSGRDVLLAERLMDQTMLLSVAATAQNRGAARHAVPLSLAIIALGGVYLAGSLLERRPSDSSQNFLVKGAVALMAIVAGCIVLLSILNRTRAEMDRLKKTLFVAQEDANLKTAVVSRVSHAIRTPATAIVGFVDLLARCEGDQNTREYWNLLRSNAIDLVNLIGDFANLASSGSGRGETSIAPCLLADLVNAVGADFKTRASDKGLVLKVVLRGTLPKSAKVDGVRLRHILTNLLSNAINFTNTGSIELGVLVTEQRRNCQVQFSVTDTGVGMTDQQLRSLLEPVVTPAGMSVGYGLVLCRHFVERLGGELVARSKVGKGSCFKFAIDIEPLNDRSQAENYAPKRVDPFIPIDARSQVPEFSGRILLAEDNKANAQLVREYLTATGLEVTTVGNGIAAFETAMRSLKHNRPFGVILTDMQMPIQDGYEATTLLRSNGYKLPIIALTASVQPSERERCFNAGCNDFISKPIDASRLYSVLQRHLTPAGPALAVAA
jgi:signal transduction histidine kinase/CheY-like chemotaxis protein